MMKILYILLGIIVALLVLFAALYAVVYRAAQRLPENNPRHFIETRGPEDNTPVLVCVGDSITHGTVSANYVDILSARLGDTGFDVVNAGINSELAYNVAVRLDDIIACHPDYVTILIGTNDANGSLSEKKAKKQVKEMSLPQVPTKEFYRENLYLIVKRLSEETDAKIALLSLPPIGENIGDEACARAGEYSAVIKEIADSERVAYLPLFEIMTNHLKEENVRPRLAYAETNPELVMYYGIFMHFVCNRDFDRIAKRNGFSLLVDFLHLNTRGATMVADLIEGFVSGK